MMLLLQSLLISLFVAFAVDASMNVQVSAYGLKFDLSGVDTVKDLHAQLQEDYGIEPSRHAILFGERRLQDDDVLSSAGVTDGARLQLIPKKFESKSYMKKEEDIKRKLRLLMKKKGVDKVVLDWLVENTPFLRENLNLLSAFVGHPASGIVLNNLETMEEMRRAILNNRVWNDLTWVFAEIILALNDTAVWRGAMTEVNNLLTNYADTEDF